MMSKASSGSKEALEWKGGWKQQRKEGEPAWESLSRPASEGGVCGVSWWPEGGRERGTRPQSQGALVSAGGAEPSGGGSLPAAQLAGRGRLALGVTRSGQSVAARRFFPSAPPHGETPPP